MRALSERFRRVRVCCGDWQRVCGPSVTFTRGITGVFLDPPYSAEAGRAVVYGHTDDTSVAHAVREWAIEQGKNPLMRVAYCDYGEADMPADWERFAWSTRGGYANQGDGSNRNRHRECVWFSPACIAPEPDLFHYAAAQPTQSLIE
jgi:hypothetical protein